MVKKGKQQDDQGSVGSRPNDSESNYGLSTRGGNSMTNEVAKLLNNILEMLKTTKWSEIANADKSVVLGLFATIGGW
jgi:hypothetical protein